MQSQNLMASLDDGTDTAATVNSFLQSDEELASGNQRAGTVTEPYDQGGAEGMLMKIMVRRNYANQIYL